MPKETGIKSSSPPLRKPHLPQNSEVQPFPLPVLPCPDIPVGGRLAHFVEQWEDPIQVSSSLIGCFKKSESIFLPIIVRRNRGASQETGSWKGSESVNSWFLFPAIPSTQKEWKVTSRNRPFLAKSLYTQTTFQNGDSQVSKTIDNVQQLGCLHRSDGCISSFSDTSDFQEVPAVHLQPSGISVQDLTVRNVPKSVDFHETYECNSSTFTPTCRISIP